MAHAYNHLFIPPKDLEEIAPIARGSYGQVFLYKWKGRGGGLTVAVKKFLFNIVTEHERREFFTEVEFMSKLSHPNVVHIFGYSVDEEQRNYSIVMEYVENGSLYDVLKDTLRFPEIDWALRWKLARESVLAVNYLHMGETPMLHRDVKSPNFLVTKNMTLKINDFGMSKIKIGSKLTIGTGDKSLGSSRWLAPETTAKVPQWTTKSDVFSLGMVFYELASRQIPFKDVIEDQQVIVLIKYEQARPELPADTPPVFAHLIKWCWDQDPTRRPCTTEILQYMDQHADVFGRAMIPGEVAPPQPQPKKRLFFEIDEVQLINSVPADCVKVLSEPPPPPRPGFNEAIKIPKPPPSITMVTLRRSQSNPLLSKTYGAQLFERVEVYFRRFFTPNDNSVTFTVDEVDVILNQSLVDQFRKAEAELHAECKGLLEFKDENQSELQRQYLNHLIASNNLISNRNSNPISAWHGANREKINSISWYGMLNLSSVDPGYYGMGIYTTQEPKYGQYYVDLKLKNNIDDGGEGKYELLLCWVLLGKPFAVTKVDMGRGQELGYTSHYTLVRYKDAKRSFCASDKAFNDVEGMTQFFPVEDDEERVQGDEIAVFKSEHILPRYIVRYSVKKNQPILAIPPANIPIVPSYSMRETDGDELKINSNTSTTAAIFPEENNNLVDEASSIPPPPGPPPPISPIGANLKMVKQHSEGTIVRSPPLDELPIKKANSIHTTNPQSKLLFSSQSMASIPSPPLVPPLPATSSNGYTKPGQLKHSQSMFGKFVDKLRQSLINKETPASSNDLKTKNNKKKKKKDAPACHPFPSSWTEIKKREETPTEYDGFEAGTMSNIASIASTASISSKSSFSVLDSPRDFDLATSRDVSPSTSPRPDCGSNSNSTPTSPRLTEEDMASTTTPTGSITITPHHTDKPVTVFVIPTSLPDQSEFNQNDGADTESEAERLDSKDSMQQQQQQQPKQQQQQYQQEEQQQQIKRGSTALAIYQSLSIIHTTLLSDLENSVKQGDIEKIINFLINHLPANQEILGRAYDILSKLTEANFVGVKTYLVTDSSVKILAQNCHNLQHVNLNWCEQITDFAVQHLAANCGPNLRSIDLNWCSNITDRGIEAIAMHCPNIEHINLCMCKLLTDRSVTLLAQSCANLQYLSLYGCSLLTDKSLEALRKNCPNLSQLVISWCQNMTDEAKEALMTNLPKLRIIE